jgi:hypothetical protein
MIEVSAALSSVMCPYDGVIGYWVMFVGGEEGCREGARSKKVDSGIRSHVISYIQPRRRYMYIGSPKPIHWQPRVHMPIYLCSFILLLLNTTQYTTLTLT